MGIQIRYNDDSYKKIAPASFVRSYLKAVCNELDLGNVSFSVSFVSSAEIQQINKEYRNIDSPTDILSFAINDMEGEDGFILPKAKTLNIGDMLICQEEMKNNAQSFNVPEEEELRRLLIHGVLHLSGRDHKTNNVDEPMLREQERILKKLSEQGL